MNLSKVNIKSLSNDELDFLAAVAMGLPAVGYYGPNKPSGGHQDYDRFDTKVEALIAYRKHWTRGCYEEGFVRGEDMSENDIYLCYWRKDWGPMVAPMPASGDKGYEDKSLEEWFFEKYPHFTMEVVVSAFRNKMDYTVEVNHDTHDFPDAFFAEHDEYRARTMAVLETLKNLNEHGND